MIRVDLRTFFIVKISNFITMRFYFGFLKLFIAGRLGMKFFFYISADFIPNIIVLIILISHHFQSRNTSIWFVCHKLLYKNYQLEKTTTAKLRQIHLYFCWAFALFHQGMAITVIFKMLHTFLLKRQSKRYIIIKFFHSNNSNGKDLTVLFKMGLSRDISKLSLISKLILLESFDKMVKSSKFMLQSQVSKWSEIADCLTFLRRLFVKCKIPICSAALT